jgi:hypothetical protein
VSLFSCGKVQRGTNVQFSGSRPVVEEGAESINDGTSRHQRCARSVRPGIRERNRQSKAVRISSGEDRSRPKSAVGKSQSESGKVRYGCSGPQEDTLGSCAKEDRCCAKGAMGKGEGGEEKCLVSIEAIHHEALVALGC